MSSSTPGLIALIGLVVAFGLWMLLLPDRSQNADLLPEVASAGAPTALAGFRSDAWLLPDDPMLGFAEIPAGPFQMGGDPTTDPLAFENERWNEDGGQGTVDLPRFYLGRFEVTVGQFSSFVEETGYAVRSEALASPPDHPVTAVSWPDALAYCRWLEGRLRDSDHTPEPLRRLLDAGGRVTLPSEAEWEKAARGTDGRVFPWGAEPRSGRANVGGDGTAPVGAYPCPECPYGIADMSGNVWEWTRSPLQPYPFDPENELVDPTGEPLWVMRGGSFGDTARNLRTSVRGAAGSDVRRPFLGFRIAISTL